MLKDSLIAPGSVWHYARCLKCGDSCTGRPSHCVICGGEMLPPDVPAPALVLAPKAAQPHPEVDSPEVK